MSDSERIEAIAGRCLAEGVTALGATPSKINEALENCVCSTGLQRFAADPQSYVAIVKAMARMEAAR